MWQHNRTRERAAKTATGTYRFKTGFYGLTDMPTEFQKAMDCTLQGLEGVICYLDDILVVTKGDVQEHNNMVEKVSQRLDAEGWALELSKCDFSVNQLTWLGYVINEDGYSPKLSKIDACSTLVHPPDSQPLLNSTAEQTDLLSFGKLSFGFPELQKTKPASHNEISSGRTNLSTGSGATA